MANILVIDDDKVMRILIKAILEFDYHTVSIAEDGVEGIKQFKSEHFDLVITDIIMPNKTGIDVINELSIDFVPIIAMSSGGNSLITLDLAFTLAQFAGATATLKKPIIPHQLRKVVRQVL